MKKFFKKLLTAFCALCVILPSLLLFACNGVGDSGKPLIVVSIYPEYDYVLSVLGEKRSEFEIRLLANGVDMHSFSPSFEDVVSISRCDVFIYVGGESDGWADDAVKNVKQGTAVIKLLDVLGSLALREKVINSDEEEDELDEHVWLSLRNSVLFVDEIAAALSALDGENASIYAENASACTAALTALDEEFAETVANAKHDTLVFGDRFPFRYLVNDYGLKYYAAYSGCSAESQVSFDTIILLADKLDELGITNLCVTETCDMRLAESIIAASNDKIRPVVTLDSLQNKSVSDHQKGETYAYCMRKNLSALARALNDEE